MHSVSQTLFYIGLLKTFQKSQQKAELYLNYIHYNKYVKNIYLYKKNGTKPTVTTKITTLTGRHGTDWAKGAGIKA